MDEMEVADPSQTVDDADAPMDADAQMGPELASNSFVANGATVLPLVGRWQLSPDDCLVEVFEDGCVKYTTKADRIELRQLCVTERGYEIDGYVAVIDDTDSACIPWVKKIDNGSEIRVEWRRPEMETITIEDVDEDEEVKTQMNATQILLQAGATLGKTKEQMDPIIRRVVEEEWHESAADLENLKDDEWKDLRVPGAVVKAARTLLQGAAASTQEPPCKRARVTSALIKEGDILEGYLYPSSKRAPQIRFAIYVVSLGEEGHLQVRVGYETKINDNPNVIVLFEAMGSYDFTKHEIIVKPNLMIEPVDFDRAFPIAGRFDRRWGKPTLIGKEGTFERINGNAIKMYKFTGFEAALHSSSKSRVPLQMPPQEGMLLGKIMEAGADSDRTAALIERMREHFRSLPSSVASLCGKWQRQLDDMKSVICNPKTVIRGPTGSGKSYLVNAVIGIPDFCSSDCSTGRAVTATTTSVSYRAWTPTRDDGVVEWLLYSISNPQDYQSLQVKDIQPQGIAPVAHQKRYGARIDLYTNEEWQREKIQYASALATYWLDDRQERNIKKMRPPFESDTGGQEAWDKLEAVYGRYLLSKGTARSWPDEDALLKHLASLESSNNVVKSLSREKMVEENNLQSFLRRMKPFQRTDPQNCGPQYWPVVKRIALFAPIERLRGVGEVVDSVGHGDSNAARNAVAIADENSASTMLIAVDITRCASNRVAIEILQNQLRYALMKHDQGDLAFVCTKADIINTREVAQNLLLKGNPTFAECVHARNTHVKSAMNEDIQKMVQDMQFGDDAKKCDWLKFQVFTVSSKSYMINMGLEKSMSPDYVTSSCSEIPALVAMLQVQALKKRNATAAKQMLALSELAAAIRSQCAASESPEEQKKVCHAEFEPLFESFKKSLTNEIDDFWESRLQVDVSGIIEYVTEGHQRAKNGTPRKAAQWKEYHPATYRATVLKEGIHPNSRKGAIHWPSELSAICYDSFQPQWMELFNSILPLALDDLVVTVTEAVEAFHNQVAEKLPNLSRLQVVRQGIKIEHWLARLRLTVTETQKEAQKDLSEEIVRAVRTQLRRDFAAAKDPTLCKGKGCVARLKDHMDISLGRLDWSMTTSGLTEGIRSLEVELSNTCQQIEAEVPAMLLDGYKVLWQDFDEQTWKQWKDVCATTGPFVDEIASNVDGLLARLREREGMAGSAQSSARRVATPQQK